MKTLTAPTHVELPPAEDRRDDAWWNAYFEQHGLEIDRRSKRLD